MIGTFLSRNLQERDVLSCILHDSSCYFGICKIAVLRGWCLKKKRGGRGGGESGGWNPLRNYICSLQYFNCRWWVVAWSKTLFLGPAVIASFLWQVLFQLDWRRVSSIFHLFVSDINQGKKNRQGEFKIVLIASTKSQNARLRRAFHHPTFVFALSA